jgi:hypothetical protein
VAAPYGAGVRKPCRQPTTAERGVFMRANAKRATGSAPVRGWLGSCPMLAPGHGSPSLCQKPRQHVPELVLAAKEDSENPDILFFFNDIKPDDGPAEGHMAKAGQNVLMQ